MTQRIALVAIIAGFTLVVCLVVTAAWVGYQGSREIRDEAHTLIQDRLVQSGRGTDIEQKIELQSSELLDRLELVLGICLFLALASAVFTIWITRRAFQKLEWQSNELTSVTWHMLQDQEQVARRFSHEMHDELGQVLTGLKAIVKRVDPAEFPEYRDECISLLDKALSGVRELSQLLRPVILDDFGLDAGLSWLVERVRERRRIEATYSSNFEGRLSDTLETHLFRIAQEALTNISRHSQATEAKVDFRVDDREVNLTIEDNGVGIVASPVKRKSSLGMVGMRARARQVGGELEIANRPEGGLRIRVTAPVVSQEMDDTANKNSVGG